ncbi:MAG: hypothetical protein NTU78_16385, partial [Alphaproteobacteria bacterium]|nr:hypothetical protein [Alphaproteobacteria bacterium]
AHLKEIGLPFRLNLTLQLGGVASLDDLVRYVNWGFALGAQDIYARELFNLHLDHLRTDTDRNALKYSRQHHLAVRPLVAALGQHQGFRYLGHELEVLRDKTEWEFEHKASNNRKVLLSQLAVGTENCDGQPYLVLMPDGKLYRGWLGEPDVLPELKTAVVSDNSIVLPRFVDVMRASAPDVRKVETPQPGIDWRGISCELWSRAAQYSRIIASSPMPPISSSQSGFFQWSALEQLEHNGPQPGAWWWIYLPLLKAVLDGGDRSIAFLVGLGHHVRVARDVVEREWIHFLPRQLDDPKNASSLKHLVRMVSYNASLKPSEKVPLLLSTTVLEALNAIDHPAGFSSPALHPLLIDCEGDDPTSGLLGTIRLQRSLPLVMADWSGVRKDIIEHDVGFAVRSLLDAHFPYTVGGVASNDAPVTANPCLPIIPCIAPQDIPHAFRVQYSQLLAVRRAYLAGLLKRNPAAFWGSNGPPSMGHWLRLPEVEARTGSPGPLADALMNYCLWLHDLTLGRGHDWSRIVSVLSWLPSLNPHRRWSSLVIYLRPDCQVACPSLKRGDEQQRMRSTIGIVPDIVASFAAASGFTADEAARADIKAEQDCHGRVAAVVKAKATACSQPVLVRRGTAWGAAFSGSGFVLPHRKGWAAIALLVKRAAEGHDDRIPGAELCHKVEEEVPRHKYTKKGRPVQVKSGELPSKDGAWDGVHLFEVSVSTSSVAAELEGVLENIRDAYGDAKKAKKNAPAFSSEDSQEVRTSVIAKWWLSSGEAGRVALLLGSLARFASRAENGDAKKKPQVKKVLEAYKAMTSQLKGLAEENSDLDDVAKAIAGRLSQYPSVPNAAIQACQYLIAATKRPSGQRGMDTDAARRVAKNIRDCVSCLEDQGCVANAPEVPNSQQRIDPNTAATRVAAKALYEHLDKHVECVDNAWRYSGKLTLDEDEAE